MLALINFGTAAIIGGILLEDIGERITPGGFVVGISLIVGNVLAGVAYLLKGL